MPKKRLVLAYLSRSCDTVAVLPAAMHHPSFREEVPPRWYQPVGVPLGQPSFKLDNDRIRCLRQTTLSGHAVYDGAQRKPTHSSRPFNYTFALTHHCCGDPSATSALCNFRADDALGSVLITPITAAHFVKLNNARSNWSWLVHEDGVFLLPCQVYTYRTSLGTCFVLTINNSWDMSRKYLVQLTETLLVYG
jgi:hypothetical protein